MALDGQTSVELHSSETSECALLDSLPHGLFRPKVERQNPHLSPYQSCRFRTRSQSPGLLLLLGLVLSVNGCSSRARNLGPSIQFTLVPEFSEGGPDRVANIEGRVSGAQSGQRLVLFARSGVWWVQPLIDEPFTQIQPDSRWMSSTHLGTEYAALLVDESYRPPATLDALPVVGGHVVAVVTVKGEPHVETPLLFGGYEWNVRTTASERGGRTNTYDRSNVFTDDQGLLHLRIAQRDGRWTCAEVTLARSLGYGTYRLMLRDAAHLEPSVVFSMFTWDDTRSDQNHREIGIEISHWGDKASKNAQFVIQPYYVPANVVRFDVPSGVVTGMFSWEPGRASFQVNHGSPAARGAVPIAEHVFSSGVPAAGGELIHLNLYVFGTGGLPKKDAEIVVEKFEYLP
jgi:hypothetical protein